jgi:hypothetical protein
VRQNVPCATPIKALIQVSMVSQCAPDATSQRLEIEASEPSCILKRSWWLLSVRQNVPCATPIKALIQVSMVSQCAPDATSQRLEIEASEPSSFCVQKRPWWLLSVRQSVPCATPIKALIQVSMVSRCAPDATSQRLRRIQVALRSIAGRQKVILAPPANALIQGSTF